MKAIITQNVDNFHQEAGSKIPVIELHGNTKYAHCLDCKKKIKEKYIKKTLKKGVKIPNCPYCGGKIKTDILLFNEPLSNEVLVKARKIIKSCDILLVLGTSLSVYPANQLPLIAKKEGAKLIFINNFPTPMDKYANLRLLGNLGRYLPMIVRDV